jgi:hypothetical protein
MSIKSTVLAATLASLTALAAGTAGTATTATTAKAATTTTTARTAHAATRSCGPRCVGIFSRGFGTHRRPGFVLAVLNGTARAGQPVILARASRTDQSEDFAASVQGQVSGLYAAGLVSDSMALRYGGLGCERYRPATSRCLKYFPDDVAYEIEYAPLGVDSGLCVGTGAPAGAGTKVSLQPCGVSARTVWVADLAGGAGRRALLRQYPVLINGSTADSAHPDVLTSPQARPADLARHQLATQPLEAPGRRNHQQWGANLR